MRDIGIISRKSTDVFKRDLPLLLPYFTGGIFKHEPVSSDNPNYSHSSAHSPYLQLATSLQQRMQGHKEKYIL